MQFVQGRPGRIKKRMSPWLVPIHSSSRTISPPPSDHSARTFPLISRALPRTPPPVDGPSLGHPGRHSLGHNCQVGTPIPLRVDAGFQSIKHSEAVSTPARPRGTAFPAPIARGAPPRAPSLRPPFAVGQPLTHEVATGNRTWEAPWPFPGGTLGARIKPPRCGSVAGQAFTQGAPS